MRYLDRTNCKKITERGVDKKVNSLPGLTREAAEIMESKRRAILKTSWGVYRIIKESGLGCPEENHPDFVRLSDADAYIKAMK